MQVKTDRVFWSKLRLAATQLLELLQLASLASRFHLRETRTWLNCRSRSSYRDWWSWLMQWQSCSCKFLGISFTAPDCWRRCDRACERCCTPRSCKGSRQRCSGREAQGWRRPGGTRRSDRCVQRWHPQHRSLWPHQRSSWTLCLAPREGLALPTSSQPSNLGFANLLLSLQGHKKISPDVTTTYCAQDFAKMIPTHLRFPAGNYLDIPRSPIAVAILNKYCYCRSTLHADRKNITLTSLGHQHIWVFVWGVAAYRDQ